MPRLDYAATAHSSASPDVVFEVLYDAPRWQEWAPLIAVSRWEDDSVEGVGAVRLAGARGSVVRERITVHEPPLRHGYEILADRPARDYRALVELTPEGAGTLIRWAGSFEPNPAITGRPYQLFLRWFMNRLAHALAREAERHQGI